MLTLTLTATVQLLVSAFVAIILLSILVPRLRLLCEVALALIGVYACLWLFLVLMVLPLQEAMADREATYQQVGAE